MFWFTFVYVLIRFLYMHYVSVWASGCTETI